MPVSTLHISGFPPDATDRELENFCRFLPGYVISKSSLDRGAPKLWVRFDCPETANAALPFIDGQPFDLRIPSAALWGAHAKTDLNPEKLRPRQDWPVSRFDEPQLAQGRNGSNSHMAPQQEAKMVPPPARGGNSQASSGGQQQPWQTLESGEGSSAPWNTSTVTQSWKRSPDRSEAVPWNKRSRTEGQISDEIDTLVVMRPHDMEMNDQLLHEYFQQIEGYCGLRMGGANCFVKFSNPLLARSAVATATQSGLQAELAKTNMNVHQATHMMEGV